MGVRMWIEKLAGETDALAELAQSYVEEAKTSEPPLNVQFHRRAAAIFHEKLEDLSSAVTEYKAIIEEEPRDEKSLAGLEAIFRTTENYSELADVLAKRLELTAGVLAELPILPGEVADALAELPALLREVTGWPANKICLSLGAGVLPQCHAPGKGTTQADTQG